MGIAPGHHETGESEREGGGEREAGGLTGLWLHQPSGCHVRTRPWASCGKRRGPQREGLVRAQARSQCKASPLGPGHTSSSRFQPCEWHHHEHPPPTLETWVPSLPLALWILPCPWSRPGSPSALDCIAVRPHTGPCLEPSCPLSLWPSSQPTFSSSHCSSCHSPRTGDTGCPSLFRSVNSVALGARLPGLHDRPATYSLVTIGNLFKPWKHL